MLLLSVAYRIIVVGTVNERTLTSGEWQRSARSFHLLVWGACASTPTLAAVSWQAPRLHRPQRVYHSRVISEMHDSREAVAQ